MTPDLMTLQWVSVKERLPKPGIPVLVYYTNSHGHGRVVRAEYSDGKSLMCDGDAWVDGCTYDDDSDSYYCPIGWYESNEYEETHWLIDDTVTHWMLLPEPPRACAADEES